MEMHALVAEVVGVTADSFAVERYDALPKGGLEALANEAHIALATALVFFSGLAPTDKQIRLGRTQLRILQVIFKHPDGIHVSKICELIGEETGKEPHAGEIQTALERMERKTPALVTSKREPASTPSGQRIRRLFKLTEAGEHVLNQHDDED